MIVQGTKIRTLYPTTKCTNMVAITDNISSSSLWHNKFGHTSEKRVKMLVSKRYLDGLKSIDLGLYESYILGKKK